MRTMRNLQIIHTRFLFFVERFSTGGRGGYRGRGGQAQGQRGGRGGDG